MYLGFRMLKIIVTVCGVIYLLKSYGCCFFQRSNGSAKKHCENQMNTAQLNSLWNEERNNYSDLRKTTLDFGEERKYVKWIGHLLDYDCLHEMLKPLLLDSLRQRTMMDLQIEILKYR